MHRWGRGPLQPQKRGREIRRPGKQQYEASASDSGKNAGMKWNRNVLRWRRSWIDIKAYRNPSRRDASECVYYTYGIIKPGQRILACFNMEQPHGIFPVSSQVDSWDTTLQSAMEPGEIRLSCTRKKGMNTGTWTLGCHSWGSFVVRGGGEKIQITS